MFTSQTYHDILSENGQRDHMIGSAWIVVVTLGMLIVLFA